MRFKTVNDYPDAELQPEAVAENPAAAPAPQSDARQRLTKLLGERDQANAEMASARASIARLSGAANLSVPFEAELAALCATDSEAMRLWSADSVDAAMPVPDVAARAALESKIAQARASAAAAASAIPALEASFTRASNKTLSITWAVNVAISEIILAEVEPDFAEIVRAKAALSAAISRAESGRDIALRGVESIPADRRPTLAAQFYAALGVLETARTAAIANPPPSYDRGPWAHLASDLARNASATIGGEG